MKKRLVNLGLKATNGILTLGASLTLGLLSYGGFYAIYPSMVLGLASFALATLYEGEIYYLNISDALKKLLKPNYFNQQKANQALALLMEKIPSLTVPVPRFLIEYQALCQEIEALREQPFSPKKILRLKQALKKQKAMQRFFAQALFNKLETKHQYAKDLIGFWAIHENGEFQKAHTQEANNKKNLIRYGLYFSIATSMLFGLGSMFLISEALVTISFVSLPLSAILSLGAVCGVAYGLLIHNCISDMLWNDTLSEWAAEVKDNIQNASPGKAILMTVSSLMLATLGMTLTIFTAGTWWSIAKNTQHLPNILKKIPLVVTAGLIPLFTGIAALIFTLENTRDSISMVIKMLNRQEQSKIPAQDNHNHKRTPIPLYQRWNPFNLLVKMIELPLRVSGFILHIASIGVTTDRIPGINQFVSAGLSTISEGFEDLHYFVDHDDEDHGHGHSHDLPTTVIRLCLSPLYLLSISWQWGFSQFTGKPISFHKAYLYQLEGANPYEDSNAAVKPLPEKATLSAAWDQQAILMKLSKEKYRMTDNSKLSQEKATALESLTSTISAIDCEKDEKAARQQMRECLKNSTTIAILAKHRNHLHDSSLPHSAQTINALVDSLAPTPKAPSL